MLGAEQRCARLWKRAEVGGQRLEVGRDWQDRQEWLRHRIKGTPTLFCKCVKRKGFKSFVSKVCETKGVADAFLRKCVKLKSLGGIFGSFELFCTND
jgi:hypothetical protein